MRFGRFVVIALLAGFATSSQQSVAQAQQPTSPSGWTFNIAPYLWLPTIDANLNYDLSPALGGRLPTDVSAGPGNYLPHLRFAGMIAADARYDRFSVLTDYIYMNVRAGGTTIKSVDFFGFPSVPISRSLQLSANTTLKSTVWTLAGGYTVLQGDWGNLDAIAGLRLLGLNASMNYNLGLTLIGPRGNGATFGGPGSIGGSANIWNGIGGVRGRIRLADTGLFIPYYFDIGAGGSNLTWQISSGIGYQGSWWAVSAQYRYLSFAQSDSAFIKHLTLGGPMMMATLSF